MDFILRHLNARGFAMLGGLIAALYLVPRYYDAPYRWYQDKKFARERGSVLATDITMDLDARESKRLKGLYRDVSAEIAAAKAHGRPVSSLQDAADAALRMDTAATRPFAMETLNRLRLAIPQPLDAVRPSAGSDEAPEETATPAASASKAPRRKRSR